MPLKKGVKTAPKIPLHGPPSPPSRPQLAELRKFPVLRGTNLSPKHRRNFPLFTSPLTWERQTPEVKQGHNRPVCCASFLHGPSHDHVPGPRPVVPGAVAPQLKVPRQKEAVGTLPRPIPALPGAGGRRAGAQLTVSKDSRVTGSSLPRTLQQTAYKAPLQCSSDP